MHDDYFGRNSITLEEAIKKFKLSKEYIEKLIETKYIRVLDLTSTSQAIFIDFDNQKKLKVLSEHPEYQEKVLDFNPSSYYDYCTELIEYHPFHDFIDRYCWLIKLFYTDKQDIKKRKYRLDVLYQNFLIKNKFSLQKLSKLLQIKGNDSKVAFHLQKGWYNELVRSLPLNSEYLKIGTNVKGSVVDATSVSWNITQTYYSIYEYTNSMAFLNHEIIRTNEHIRPTNIFNNGTLNKLKKHILFYPFFLSSQNTSPNKYPDHSDFEYASYPRDSSKRLQDVNKDVVKTLKKLSKNDKENNQLSLVNFLREFRVWSNYTGMETIIKLRNGHLLEYLYKNLGTLSFFVGGMAELAALAKVGEEEYLKILNNFVNDYVLKQPQFESNILLIPLFIRHRIYKHLGIISAELPYLSSFYKDPIVLINKDQASNKKVQIDSNKLLSQLKKMSIREIAEFIISDWSKQGKVSKSYLEPMLQIKTLNDYYFADSGSNVLSYFLASAKNWHGENARITKKYLNKLLSEHRQKI